MSGTIAISSKHKDLSIEMLKALAAILVMNCHMDAMYGEYAFLSTGGTIGNALFFFCSGYTLFLSKREVNFFNWYKTRVQRILPSILVISLIGAKYAMAPQHPIIIVDLSTYWFIPCIFIYYALLFPIKRYMTKYIWWVVLVNCVLILLWYFIFGVSEISKGDIYGPTYFKWCLFFLFMLLGSICGRARVNSNDPQSIVISSNPNIFIVSLGVLCSVILFYAIYYYTKLSVAREPYQLFSIIPLVASCWFMWRLANTNIGIKLMQSKVLGYIIQFVGGLCLEILLCQELVFTTKFNHIFPWNILLIMTGVILLAYVIRILSRFLLQTFQKEDYNWRAMIAPF